MSISHVHTKVSSKSDGPDSTLIQPSDWNAQHTITLAGSKVLGRDTTGAGAVQELPIAVTSGGDVQLSGALGYFIGAVGSSGQRPGSPAAGMFRYNTTTGAFEGYTSSWQNFALGSPVGVTTTRGDIIIRGPSGDTRLPIGTATYVLTSDGTDPSWQAATGGGGGGGTTDPTKMPLAGGVFSGSVRMNQNATDSPGVTNTVTGSCWQVNGQGAALFISRSAFVPLGLNVNQDDLSIQFLRSGTPIGSVYTTSSSVSFLTTSDYRLKENVEPLTGALDRLARLQVRRFNWIAAKGAPKVDGFIAHEVAEVVPEAIQGEKDAVHTEDGQRLPPTPKQEEAGQQGDLVHKAGSIKPQGIDQAKLVPLLTAALQELRELVVAQAARIAVLEAK